MGLEPLLEEAYLHSLQINQESEHALRQSCRHLTAGEQCRLVSTESEAIVRPFA